MNPRNRVNRKENLHRTGESAMSCSNIGRGAASRQEPRRRSVFALLALLLLGVAACEGDNLFTGNPPAASGGPPATPLILVSDLVEAGADPDLGTRTGWRPLMVAASSNPVPDVVRALVAAGADVNASDDLGWTPLIAAAARSVAPAVVAALLESGADPQRTDVDGRRALTFAQENPAIHGSEAYWTLQAATFR